MCTKEYDGFMKYSHLNVYEQQIRVFEIMLSFLLFLANYDITNKYFIQICIHMHKHKCTHQNMT